MMFNDEVDVLGKEDIEKMLRQAKKKFGDKVEHQDGVPVIQFGCQHHAEDGVKAFYENGVIILVCMICDRVKSQIEIAEKSRETGMEYNN